MSDKEKTDFTFIDLFAGIGGFHYALSQAGFKCVFTSEWDEDARATYEENFKKESPAIFARDENGNTPLFGGDITKINASDIPPHDVLCGGFPCQPFSSSGKQMGFADTRGTLFFDVMRIVKEHKPKVVLLENVKNLIYHDGGRTIAVIIGDLERAGYRVNYKILNAKDFGVPQNRERIIIVGTLPGYEEFDFSKVKNVKRKSVKDIMDPKDVREILSEEEYTLIDEEKINQQKSGLIFVGYRNKTIRKAGVRPNTEHLSRVHKQPNRIYSSEGTHPTIPSQESSGRYFVLHNGEVVRLSLEDCYRLMGFPRTHKVISPKAKAYNQVGNAVCVPMVEKIAEEIKRILTKDDNV